VEGDKVMVTEAAEMLGVTKEKVARLIKKGVLTAEPSMLDARRKLIPRVQVEAILANEGHAPAKRRKDGDHDSGETAS
jgi:excisionase family DNA binding protein